MTGSSAKNSAKNETELWRNFVDGSCDSDFQSSVDLLRTVALSANGVSFEASVIALRLNLLFNSRIVSNFK